MPMAMGWNGMIFQPKSFQRKTSREKKKNRAGPANPQGSGEVWGLLAVNLQHLPPPLEPEGRPRAGLGAGNGSWRHGSSSGPGHEHNRKSQVDVWMFSQPRNRVSPRAKNTGKVTGWKGESPFRSWLEQLQGWMGFLPISGLNAKTKSKTN